MAIFNWNDSNSLSGATNAITGMGAVTRCCDPGDPSPRMSPGADVHSAEACCKDSPALRRIQA